MLIQSSVGQGAYQGIGATPNLRSGKLGDTILSELHGRYYEQTYNTNMFTVAVQSVATTTVGLATTYTGLCLSNPIGSTVNLVMAKCSVVQSVIQSSNVETYNLAVGSSATTQVVHTTPATILPCKVGSGATSKANADTSATLPAAPVYSHFIAATSTIALDPTLGFMDLEGSIILTPGAYIVWATPANASVAGLWFSFSWEEVPL